MCRQWPHAISPPTEDEVLFAINRLRASNGKYAIVSDPDRPIELVKLLESEDDQRFVPLIGNARLHRTFYQCVIQLDESDEQQLVIIDHNHFHKDQ